MKATVKISELTAALARLKSVASRKATLPVLSGVLIEARDGQLRLMATDLDQYLILEVEAEMLAPGALVVPCARLQAALVKMDGEWLAMEASAKNVLKASAGAMWFELRGLPAEEMPKAPEIMDAVEAHFGEGVIAEVIGRELVAVSDDETRFALNGVFVTGEKSAIQFVSTDGRRLAMTEIEGEPLQGGGLNAIVPTLACQQMACLDGGGVTTMRVSAEQIEASGKGWRLISKLIEGNYPNWKMVMPPSGGAHRFSVSREKLEEALAFAATLTAANSVLVRIQWLKKKLRVSAATPDIGCAEAEIDSDTRGGEMVTAFSPVFLLQALKTLVGETVTGEMADESSPLRMADGKTVHVIMPMRNP